MKSQKKQQDPTATALLRALVDAMPKSEFWTPELYRAHRAAVDFLEKGKSCESNTTARR